MHTMHTLVPQKVYLSKLMDNMDGVKRLACLFAVLPPATVEGI